MLRITSAVEHAVKVGRAPVSPSRVVGSRIVAISLLVFVGAACSSDSNPPPTQLNAADVEQVLQTNAQVALAGYEDSLATARTMQTAIQNFIGDPTEGNLDAARTAWKEAREAYGPTEAFRFMDGPIDDANGPEGQLNAWPLAEAIVDYVAAEVDGSAEAAQYPTLDPAMTSNIVADNSAAAITADLIKSYNEADGDEANVATGYHAIEFLLWGQDL
ncbi:hypothetical protein MK280_16115, partial [Myxococcota bacterium]|nr:hypothetical protein [Myxococcota bacterium]